MASQIRTIKQRAKHLSLALAVMATTTACSTVSGWFADDEELEIRQLAPIEAQFSPKVLWDRDIGKGVDKYFSRLRPVAEYGKIFVADRHGKVAALDPETGRPSWDIDLAVFNDEGMFDSVSRLWRSGESAKIGGLAVAYEKVYLGTENGNVIALDSNSGEVVWSVGVGGEVIAAPAVDEGILLVNTSAGILYGLDAYTGEEKWQYETDVPPLSLRGISRPAAINGGAIVGTPNGKLQVNILTSGLLAWETVIATPTGATELDRIVDVDSAPVVAGSVVYTIAYNGTLAAVELRSGRLVWKREYGAYRNVIMDGNQLFVVDNSSQVYALDRRNGVELWSQSSLKGRELTAAEPFNGQVVVGDNYGYLHWLDKQTGEIVARLEVGSDDEDEAIYVSPIVAGDKLVAVTRDGQVAAITVP